MSKATPWRSQRVLHPKPLNNMDENADSGGGDGLEAAQAMTPADIVSIVGASGLRGRGGAGFPVGRKWTTIVQKVAELGEAATVVVNVAEGEPGTFKDRSIIRNNPYQVIEGALIAARAVGANAIVVATKEDFVVEVERLKGALADMSAAGHVPDEVGFAIFEGPDEYLYGEESALLEAVDGRATFPRVTPTYRVGLVGDDRTTREKVGPALVNNLESIANIPKIVKRGADWFRRVGTEESPGTAVCTITGDVREHGVAEVRLGTPLRKVIREIGGGPAPGKPIKAILAGVANPVITARDLNVPVSYEGLREIGSGMGSAGFIVFDRDADMVAVAAGVARFLSVESCGQCTPCKLDGMQLTTLLTAVAANEASARDLDQIVKRIHTVARGARCYLGTQQEILLESILEEFAEEFQQHIEGALPPVEPTLIAELKNIDNGEAVIDERHRSKQPDWTYNPTYSGFVPVEIRSTTSSPLGADGLPTSGW